MSEERFCPRCRSALHFPEGTHPACTSCEFVLYRDPKVAVAAVIEREGGILLVRRAIDPGMGLWSFPAGFVDRGEMVQEALRRELREELSLEIDVEDLVGVYSKPGHAVVLIVYSASVRSDSPALVVGPENTEACSFDPQGFPPMAFSHDRQIVADWLRGRCPREGAS